MHRVTALPLVGSHDIALAYCMVVAAHGVLLT